MEDQSQHAPPLDATKNQLQKHQLILCHYQNQPMIIGVRWTLIGVSIMLKTMLIWFKETLFQLALHMNAKQSLLLGHHPTPLFHLTGEKIMLIGEPFTMVFILVEAMSLLALQEFHPLSKECLDQLVIPLDARLKQQLLLDGKML
jgi:hypothetical protein